MRPLSIRAKIIAVTTLSIVLVAGLLGGIYVFDQTRRMRDFEQRIMYDSARSAATIAYTVMPAVVESDFARLAALVSHYRNRSDRLYVAVLDSDGRILADSGGGEINSQFRVPPGSEAEALGEGSVRRYLTDGKEGIEVSSPIKAGDLVLGSVRIGLNTDWLRQEKDKMRSTLLISLLAALAIVLFGIFIASALSRKITEPLLLLREASEGIRQGDYDRLPQIRSGDETGVLAQAFARMAHDLRKSRTQLVEKEALQASEARLREAQQIAHIGHWDWDITTGRVGWSDELYRIYGYSPHEIEPNYSLVVEAMHRDSRDAFLSAIDAALKGERPFELDYTFTRKDGSQASLHSIGRVLRDEGGSPLRMVGTVQDLTLQRRAEEDLRESEEKLRTFFESANDAIFMLDLEGNFIDVNRAAHARLGYSREEMLAMNLVRLDPPHFAARVPERIGWVVDRGQAVFETAHMRKDGGVMPVEVNARTIELRGRKVIFSVIRDITDRKAAEEKIRSALAEKEILLKEVHHRVKNNLQLVSSMLYLQSGYVREDEARWLFEESQKRVEAMALIHEKLYGAKDLEKVDFREYVDGLAGNLSVLGSGENKAITMKTEVEGVSLDVNNSIPCGLIINELVTNALRHAFPDRREGEIVIRMSGDAEGRVLFSVSDDGIGFPPEIDFRNTQSLGLQLVTSLVVQLGGGIELDSSRGTSFTVVFKA